VCLLEDQACSPPGLFVRTLLFVRIACRAIQPSVAQDMMFITQRCCAATLVPRGKTSVHHGNKAHKLCA
jgi:hypothetical protein